MKDLPKNLLLDIEKMFFLDIADIPGHIHIEGYGTMCSYRLEGTGNET